MAEVIVYRNDPWKFKWEGGRLADVYHVESDEALDAVSVGTYDGNLGKQLEPFTKAVLKESADEWVRDTAPDYVRELPYLLR